MTDSDRPPSEPLVEPLTRREREILTYLAEGFSAPEIAEQLTLAVSSVKFHIQNVYSKLGAKSKRQALTRAAELGLLETRPVISALGSTPFQPPRPQAPPVSAARNNLPLQVTQFFGREGEIAQLKERLAAYRLVTLSGSGGVGKTRLSVQVAEAVLANFSDGVWLVELAPLTDPALVPQHVAATLGVPDEPGRPVLETLLTYLHERQILLVLDNCEHLLESCARLAEALLRGCPRVKLLASSREPLGIPGEAVFPIPSLPFPDQDAALSAEGVKEYASVQLFLDRARMVLPDYQLAEHNAAAVTRICQRLDGIPLAIEMAAARVNVVNAEQVAQRLDDVFRVLTGGSRTALPRQQTLRATVDWSYKLLNEQERLLLRRLSVFAGGWLLEAAEEICSGEGIDAGQVLELLGALVAKSMVIADRPRGDEPRYHLLETVRQYAREKLQDTDDGARLRTRHRDYFLDLAEAAYLKTLSTEKFSWEKKLRAELENFRLALHWSLDDLNEPTAGPRLMLALPFNMSTLHETLDWLKQCIALCERHTEIPGQMYAELLSHAAALVSRDDPQKGLVWNQQAVDISRRLGVEGKERLLWSLFGLAFAHEQIHDAEHALEPFAEAKAILASLGPDRYAQAERSRVDGDFASLDAHILNGLGQYRAAKVSAGESIRLHEASGNWWNARSAHVMLAVACLNLREYDQAREHLAGAIRLDDVMHHPTQIAYELRCLATLELQEGNLGKAIENCQESIRQADSLPDRNIIASCLGILAGVTAKLGQSTRAARFAGASEAIYARQHRKPWEDSSLDTLLPGWRDGPEFSELNEAFIAGQAMTAEQAVAMALENPDPNGLAERP